MPPLSRVLTENPPPPPPPHPPRSCHCYSYVLAHAGFGTSTTTCVSLTHERRGGFISHSWSWSCAAELVVSFWLGVSGFSLRFQSVVREDELPQEPEPEAAPVPRPPEQRGRVRRGVRRRRTSAAAVQAHVEVLLLRRAPPGHRWLPPRQHGGEGRVRRGVPRRPGRRARRRREAPGADGRGGREEGEGLPHGAGHGGPRPPPQRARASRLLRRPRPPPRLRVLHPRLRLRQPPRLEAAGDVVEAAARDRGRHGARAALPPQGLRAPDHPPRHQGLQHPPHRRLRASDFGLRPRPVAAVGVDAPRHRAHRGHVRVPGARVLHARHRGREDGRVRLRRLPPRAHLRPEAGGRLTQEPHRVGQALPERRRRARARGPAARRRLRRRAAEAAHVRRVALRQGRRGVAPDHDTGTGVIRVR